MYDAIGKLPILNKLIPNYSYKKNLYRIETPLLAIAGNDDKAADPREVKFCSKNVRSQDVTYVNFSKKEGYSIDYGHLDLNLGIKVNEEVYPFIYNWLQRRTD